MNADLQTAVTKGNNRESKAKLTASTLMRLAGLSAMLAGLSYIVVGMFHPANVSSSVTSSTWAIVHIFAMAMSFFGLFGLAGLYVRQVEKAGWLGLAGFVMFSLWLTLVMGFSFVETLILPQLATELPTFVDGFLGMFAGSASETDLGALPTLWTISGPLYMLGGLLFGIATFRAAILSRWAAGILAAGTSLAPVAALLPSDREGLVAVPVGLALAWLGYALLSERREISSEPVPDQRTTRPELSKAA